MTRPLYVVTGATGKTGGAVVRELLARGERVRGIVRCLDARAQDLQRRGAEIAVANLFDADQILDAIRGAQRAYFVPVFQPHVTQSAVAFLLAAKAARLDTIVQLSQWLSHSRHPSVMTRESWLIEQLFAETPGIAHIVINPGMFADNFLRVIDWASLLRVYPYMTGGSRSAPVSNEDIARVVASVITRPQEHAGRSYRPTGPRLLSAKEMALVLEGVLGQSITAVPTPDWMFLKVARLTGVSDHEAYSYVQYMADHRAGAFEFDGGVNDVVTRLTGRPAESFADIASRYAHLPAARPTAANRIKALGRFMIVPLVRGLGMREYERRMAFPAPPTTGPAQRDERWLRQHSDIGAGNRMARYSLEAS